MLEDSKLKVFAAVVETGSFTKAASQLGITQPAVSQNIADLEKSLGVVLFDRTKGAVSLTQQGQLFKLYADKIMHWYSAANSIFGTSLNASFTRPISIAADNLCNECLLPNLISSMLATSKGLKFIIKDYNKNQNIDDEIHDGADIFMYTNPRYESMDLASSASLVGVVQATVVSSSQKGAFIDEIISLDEIPVGCPLAVWTPYVRLLSQDVIARISVSSDSIDHIKTLISNNHGYVGIIPYNAVDNKFKIHPIPLPHLQLDLHIKASEYFINSEIYSRFKVLLDQFLASE